MTRDQAIATTARWWAGEVTVLAKRGYGHPWEPLTHNA